jgi:hypothetical protein
MVCGEVSPFFFSSTGISGGLETTMRIFGYSTISPPRMKLLKYGTYYSTKYASSQYPIILTEKGIRGRLEMIT